MRLNEWFAKNPNTKPVDFARKLGVSHSNVYRYLDGSRRPSPETAVRIGQITGGQVGLGDLYEPKPAHRTRRRRPTANT